MFCVLLEEPVKRAPPVFFSDAGCFHREKRENCGVKMNKSRIRCKIFNLKNNFLLLTFSVIVVSLLVSDFLISDKIGSLTYNNLEIKVSEIANIVANAPVVRDTLAEGTAEDQKDLEVFTEKIMELKLLIRQQRR